MHRPSSHTRSLDFEATYGRLADRIRLAFIHQPSLAVSAWQISEWLELDDDLSARALGALTEQGWLERSYDGLYRLLIRH
jgi:hypothetical protein